MRSRGQDSEEVIAQRLAAAREEMSHYDEFDYVIVNEHFDDRRRRDVRDLRRQPPAPATPQVRARHRALITGLLATEPARCAQPRRARWHEIGAAEPSNWLIHKAALASGRSRRYNPRPLKPVWTAARPPGVPWPASP